MLTARSSLIGLTLHIAFWWPASYVTNALADAAPGPAESAAAITAMTFALGTIFGLLALTATSIKEAFQDARSVPASPRHLPLSDNRERVAVQLTAEQRLERALRPDF